MSGPRALLWSAAALLLLLASAAAGLWFTTRVAPARLAAFAERALAERLGPVEVGAVQLGFAWGPALELHEIRTRAGADDAPRLAARRVVVGFELRSLLAGRLRIGRIEVDGLAAALAHGPAGWQPEALGRLLEGMRGGPSAATPGDVDGAVAALRRAGAHLPRVRIRDGRVQLALLAADGAVRRELGWSDLELSLRREHLGAQLALDAGARLVERGGARGRIGLRAALPHLGEPALEVALADVDVAALADLPGVGAALRGASGRASAYATWRLEEGAQRGACEAVLLDLRVDPVAAELHLAAPSARIRFAYEVTRDAVALRDGELVLGPIAVSGRARTGRPWRPDARVDLALRGAPLEADALRRFVLGLGAPPRVREAVERIRAGRLASWTIEWDDATRGAWAAFVADPLGAWPTTLALEAAFADVSLRLDGSDPLQGLTGRVALARDRIALHDVAARLGDRPLPRLDLAVSGVAAVLDALADPRRPRPVPALPGIGVLDAWVDAQHEPGAPPRWRQARIAADWIDHPVLLRPVEALHVTLEPADPGFRADDIDARWGTARVTGHLHLTGRPPHRLEAELHAEPAPPRAAPDPRAADPAAWARGRFDVDLEKLGPVRAERVAGEARFVGRIAEVRAGESALVPHGRLGGELDLRLDDREAVPVAARLRLSDASVPDLLADLELDAEAMTGRADLTGTVGGRLVPGVPVLAELAGPVEVRLRDGEIRRRMPLLLAIAAASDTLNPFRSRETLPYEAIEGRVQLDHGTLRTEDLSLTGPAVRMVATGSVDAVNHPHPVEAVVGLFFFRTIDAVISRVPIVNRLILGRDDNLVAAYFAVSGPWSEARADVIPVRSILSPASIVTEGVPGFVRSGLATLERLLGGQAPAPPDPAAEGEAAEPLAPPAPEAPAPPDARGRAEAAFP